MSNIAPKVVNGLAITTPLLGRISIGRTIEREDGSRLPKKNDFITLTGLAQVKGEWLEHSLNSKIKESSGLKAEEKLRSIPVRVAYSRPDLTLRSSYCCWAPDGRMLCSGDGEKAKRVNVDQPNEVDEIACPSPDLCRYGKVNRCRGYARALFRVEGQNNETAAFIHRTTSVNAIRSLSGHLIQLYALLGTALRFMPLQLVLRSKSSAMSKRTVFYYLDIETRQGMSFEDAVREAKKRDKEWREDLGIDVEQLEDGMVKGLEASNFEFSVDEEEMFEEFGGVTGQEGEAEEEVDELGVVINGGDVSGVMNDAMQGGDCGLTGLAALMADGVV